jgi:putative ABC transport system substrate-binding protein
VVARAQQPALPVIGWLGTVPGTMERFLPSLAQGLAETGYVVGRNVAIESREGSIDRLPALAADLVGHRVAAIVTYGVASALAAKAATPTIPIVFITGNDPVALGLVASLNRPGANVTGGAFLQAELGPKQLQLLRELVPNAARFGVLADPRFFVTQSKIADLQAAARTLGLQVVVVNASKDSDLETAFATFSQQRVGAALIVSTSFFDQRLEQLAALAGRHGLPAIYSAREYPLAGGLMSYGGSLGYEFHQAGIYTGRILKGEKPADLPVEQLTKIELVINLKTAKALGIEIPTALLVRADEVIE